jgi:SAM-dependent methyltransferase
MSTTFDLARSRDYWRFVPSGIGKLDTTALLKLGDGAFERVWDEAFLARFRGYPEEDAFLGTMGRELAGRRVLSVGAGFGFHEIYYHLNGARVTACDIVPSNVEAITRIARIKGADGFRAFLTAPGSELGGPYDVVMLYGSLMTMPERMQRDLLARCREALAPDGRLLLMLYTFDFARGTCGFRDDAEFVPEVFARASDPSVGDEACPWSDWHDDAKIEDYAGGGFRVARRQIWNQGWFVWHELRRGDGHKIAPFFSPAPPGEALRTLDPGTFEPVGGRRLPGGIVETDASKFGYVLVSPVYDRTAEDASVNAVAVDADLREGGFSLGILDADADKFSFSQAIWQQGPGEHLFRTPPLPARFRIILSNHVMGEPSASRFRIGAVRLLAHPSVSETWLARRRAGIAADASVRR